MEFFMARPANSNPFGKCDQELKVAIDEQTRDALVALAFAAELPLAEYVRTMLHLHVHGHGGVMRARMAGTQQGRE
jgi:hypothetical protein